MANQFAYMTGSTDPWGVGAGTIGSNEQAMDTAFGVGAWDDYQGFTATALTNGHKVIIIDGGDGVSGEFETFVNANRAALEQFVSNGGVLMLNAARWTTPDLDLGFGGTLIQSYSNYGYAVDPTHAIWTGENGAVDGTVWGNYFSHDYVSGSGFTNLVVDGGGQGVLVEKAFGAGHVVLGGITIAYYHGDENGVGYQGEEVLDFQANIYDYLGSLASGNNINAGSGADVVVVGGDPTKNTSAGDDTVNAGSGNDIVYGGNGDDRLLGDSGHDTLHGEAGEDQLLGDRGNDQLNGGGDNDSLNGGTGNDTLNGGAGDNWFIGGDGADYFVFGAASTGDDTIADFSGSTGDRIVLTGGVTFTASGYDSNADTVNDATLLTLSTGGEVVLSGVTTFNNAWVI